MKKMMILLFACSMSYALNAPYLISATALSDTSVGLSWRNNDAATTGFIIQRKDSTATIYHFVDSVKSASQLTYTDMNGLLPSTLYTYQVIAYDATEVSDTSNSLQVTTLMGIFIAPAITLSGWNPDTSKTLQITIFDNANCETGYRIYRDQNFSSSFNLIADIVSANPKNIGDTIIWSDNTVSNNTWYRYKVAVYKGDSSLYSASCSTYTFHYVQPQQVVIFQKISDYPVSDTGSWSAKAGDSIILKENNSPAGMFTVINVSNPANPNFVGYIDSTKALSYPLQTLIPVFINFGVSNRYANTSVVNYGNRMLIARDSLNIGRSSLKMYRIDTNHLTGIDSLAISDPYMLKLNLLLFNDTVLGIQYFAGDYVFHFYDVFLSSTGFSPLFIGYQQPIYISTNNNRDYPYYVALRRLYVHGIINRNIFISCDFDSAVYNYDYSTPPPYKVIVTHETKSTSCNVYNISNNANALLPDSMPYTNAYNTNHYLSPTEILCTSGLPLGFSTTYGESNVIQLFASDISDPHPYSTASTNNAIYQDNHAQYYLQNLILDTLNKHVFLIFNDNMSILSYQRTTTGVISKTNKTASSKGLMVLSSVHVSGVTIILPGHSTSSPADLYFYDLSGRVIDRILGVTTNAVLWRPKTRSMNCYIIMARIGGEKYTKKFMIR